MCHTLIELLSDLAEQINWVLKWNFRDCDRRADHIPEGVFTLPLHTDDLRFTYYEASGSAPGGWGWMLAEEIEADPKSQWR